jgi:hypothetical protein
VGNPEHPTSDANAPPSRRALSASAWAALTALGAAAITGGVTLVTHFIPGEDAAPPSAVAPDPGALPSPRGSTSSKSATSAVDAPRSALLDQLTGRWSGEVRAGLQDFTMTLDITSTCAEGGPCGTMTTNLLPCVGDITLVRVRDGPEFDFATVRFRPGSSASCALRPQGGDYFTLGADVLAYVTGYDGSVRGTLERVG